ncbi:hypothetical protein FHR72_000674 [Mycolicibacterium iranicum]|uniref:DUF4333 domain-containing protein n=1 Tax=Mycolicibacterium iranicum TaxID=912594 RepID=A0A839Q0F0_MYCIR|nr:DUF4333 domain-containing protein [Mycolicibacterium iranicum]MBB2989217.1 hypothetical protein [Mycolicibacterium iranicum]
MIKFGLACGAALTMSACSFSFGGLDYDKLETKIRDALNTTYSDTGETVSRVECPEQSPGPEAGDSLQCTAEVGGQTVRVDAKVTNDEYDVEYETRDTLFDLQAVADGLSDEVSRQVEFPVTVDCGEGLKPVEVGKTFDCSATDTQGEQRTLRITAAPVGEDDSWELLS